ncbi:hypothetical protein [Nonomuraea sp. B19D2]|uniref:hypothetical protein n=1 Tax=Nonomuraea sp. B19D2 TaxID=3159561 RepID=UPI0032DB68A5
MKPDKRYRTDEFVASIETWGRMEMTKKILATGILMASTLVAPTGLETTQAAAQATPTLTMTASVPCGWGGCERKLGHKGWHQKKGSWCRKSEGCAREEGHGGWHHKKKEACGYGEFCDRDRGHKGWHQKKKGPCEYGGFCERAPGHKGWHQKKSTSWTDWLPKGWGNSGPSEQGRTGWGHQGGQSETPPAGGQHDAGAGH